MTHLPNRSRWSQFSWFQCITTEEIAFKSGREETGVTHRARHMAELRKCIALTYSVSCSARLYKWSAWLSRSSFVREGLLLVRLFKLNDSFKILVRELAKAMMYSTNWRMNCSFSSVSWCSLWNDRKNSVRLFFSISVALNWHPSRFRRWSSRVRNNDRQAWHRRKVHWRVDE